jgi:mannose-6-phosphate isomerase-like protein (cupin superfamily)
MSGDHIHIEVERLATGARQSVASLSLESGGVVPEHFHRESEEIFVCLSGRGELEIDGVSTSLTAGVAVLVPVGAKHSVANAQPEPLRLLVMSSPPYDENDVYYE